MSRDQMLMEMQKNNSRYNMEALDEFCKKNERTQNIYNWKRQLKEK